MLPFIGLGTSDTVWTGGDRVSALGQNTNSAAMILAAGLVALIGLTLLRRQKSAANLVLAGALSVVLGFAIIETGSRGGFAALIGGVLVLAFAAAGWRQRLRNGAIALIAVTLLAGTAAQLPVMRNRLLDAVQTGNLAGREQLYPALWTMFLEKPVMGWGPTTNNHELAPRVGERERAKRASHNLLLELLTAGGLVMTLPFLVGLWQSASSAWRARLGMHGALPSALLCSLFLSNMSGDWGASKLLWIVLAYAVASSKWRIPARGPTRVHSRRWVMALPSDVRS